MFQQLLAPVGESLGLSFLVAILPAVAVLILLGVFRRSAWQAALASLIVGLVIAVAVWQMPPGLAYLMNYSGLAHTLGQAVASTGHLFVLLSPFPGWVAVLLSGSDTSRNALFGNLQVVAARQLNLNPVLFAATNSSGGVMGKMISPQNIGTGVSVTNLKGHEGVLVAVQQYLIPWTIPTVGVAS